MKKKLAILLVLMMVLAMSSVAFAAGTGSITVENATVGQNYAGYKIFDATWTADKDAVSYTIDSGSAWYDLVSADGSPFNLTQVGSTTTYNVAVATGKTDADIIAWIQGKADGTLPATNLASTEATTTTVSWDNVPYGYYLITSELGAVVTVTNHNANRVIRDKNQKPVWETPEDPTDPTIPDRPPGTGNPADGKNVSADGEWYGATTTASIGDTVYFKINAFVPKYNDEKQVYEYTFTDTLDSSFDYDAGSLTLAINGTEKTAVTDYTVDVTGQKITVTLKVNSIENYPTDAKMEINYTATVNTDAVYDNMNKVEMDWTEFDPVTDPSGNAPQENDPNNEPGDSTTNTYVYGFNLQKYAGPLDAEGNGTKLEGAEFRLYDALTGGNEIKVVLDNGVYRVAVTSETGVVIPAGAAKIFGLAAGTYYLEEVTTPDGYNPLTARQAVVITDTLAEDNNGYLLSEVAVVNLTGTVLPETGGIGTTIFYVVGGLMMLGAVVLLVTRKKMSASRN